MAAKVSSQPKGFQPDSDVHITFEDQQKINQFAKNNARLEDCKHELELKRNSLKTLQEATDEIELFDEDEMIPYLIGEVFMSHNLSTTAELLKKEKLKKQNEIKTVEESCRMTQGLINDLKSQLYLRFGSNISLENDD